AYSRALPRAIPPPCRFLPRRASSPGTPFASRVGHPVCSLVQACSRALPRAIPPPCRFLPRRASSPGTPFASRVGHPVEGGALGVLVGPGIFSRATTRDTTTLPLPAPASKLAGDPVRVEGGAPGRGWGTRFVAGTGAGEGGRDLLPGWGVAAMLAQVHGVPFWNAMRLLSG